MKSFQLFLITFLSMILLSIEKNEEKKAETKTSKKKEKKKKSKNKKNDEKTEKKVEEKKLIPPPPLTFISDIPDDTYNLLNDNIYLLTDKTFDKVLQNGNNYRWFVILFSETCGHCYFTRTQIRKILPEYKYSSYLRFAEIEININPMVNQRFNYIEGVPYIFKLQNNTMYIMDSYPSPKNLVKFIEKDLTDFLPQDKKPFPQKIKINLFSLEAIQDTFEDLTNNINEFLDKKGIKLEFSPLTLLITIVFFFIILFYCCSIFAPDDKKEIKEEEKKDYNDELKNIKEKDEKGADKNENKVFKETKINKKVKKE